MPNRLVERLRGIFTFIPERGEDREEPLRGIDLNRLDAAEGFSKEAAHWGERNLPHFADTMPDAGHQRLRACFARILAAAHAAATRRLSQYRTTLSPRDPHSVLEELRRAPEESGHELAARVANHRAQTDLLNAELNRAQQDLDSFRRSQALQEAPHYPDSRIAYITVPILLFALDVGFNAIVFSSAHEGLRGGIRIALILGIMNVGIAAFLGRGATCLFRREPWLKFVGALCVALLVALVPFNFFVGHYRDIAFSLQDVAALSLDQMTNRAENIFTLAREQFVRNWLGFRSPESGALSIVSIVIVVISAIDGLFFDGLVPGYARRHRRINEMRELLHENTQRFRAELNRLREGQGNALARKEAEFRQAAGAARSYESLCRAVVLEYRALARECEEAYHALVQRYRAENRSARKDGLAPGYFNLQAEALEVPAVEEPADVRVALRYEEMEAAVARELGQARNRIAETWDRFNRDSTTPAGVP